jgi:hypothetical protein
MVLGANENVFWTASVVAPKVIADVVVVWAVNVPHPELTFPRTLPPSNMAGTPTHPVNDVAVRPVQVMPGTVTPALFVTSSCGIL